MKHTWIFRRGAWWRIKVAYTPSFKVRTAPFQRSWYVDMFVLGLGSQAILNEGLIKVLSLKNETNYLPIMWKRKTSWWLNQPLWKILVKVGSSSPIFEVKITNYLNCHHLGKKSSLISWDFLLPREIFTTTSWLQRFNRFSSLHSTMMASSTSATKRAMAAWSDFREMNQRQAMSAVHGTLW